MIKYLLEKVVNLEVKLVILQMQIDQLQDERIEDTSLLDNLFNKSE